MTWDKFQKICEDNGFNTRFLKSPRLGFAVNLKNQEVIDFFGMIKELK